jgi:D-alanine--poly(phosphoribitol) ligase subunit 2
MAAIPESGSTTAERTLTVLRTVLDGADIGSDLDVALYASGILDSLRTVELIVGLSEEFGIEISPAEFDRQQWSTPRGIISDMTTRITQ